MLARGDIGLVHSGFSYSKAVNGLSLLDDIIFRGVFGRQKNGPALAAFLSALLHRQGPDKITQVEILNPLRETDSLDEKQGKAYLQAIFTDVLNKNK